MSQANAPAPTPAPAPDPTPVPSLTDRAKDLILDMFKTDGVITQEQLEQLVQYGDDLNNLAHKSFLFSKPVVYTEQLKSLLRINDKSITHAKNLRGLVKNRIGADASVFKLIAP